MNILWVILSTHGHFNTGCYLSTGRLHQCKRFLELYKLPSRALIPCAVARYWKPSIHQAQKQY